MSVSILPLVKTLFHELHAAGILYCSWKGNDHLETSMAGGGDLDILFDKDHLTKLKFMLHRLGFKEFCAVRQKQQQGVLDFIALDSATGKIVHLHSYFRLALGKVFLKNYPLNVEEEVLKGRIYNATLGVYCIQPAMELMLLCANEALCLRRRDLVRSYLFNKPPYSAKMAQKFCWLRERSTESQLQAVQQAFFSENPRITQLVCKGIDNRGLRELAHVLKEELEDHREYAPTKALLLRWYNELYVKLAKKAASLLQWPVPARRINPRAGLIVAVVGADGSGKSTVSQEVLTTFAPKVDLCKLYFGRGDGKIGWQRQALYSLKGLVERKDVPGKSSHQLSGVAEKKKGFLADVYRCIEALLVANEKRVRLACMLKARRKGMLVVCDRFPQNQFMGYNDGPLLHYLSTSRNPVFRIMSKIEANVYAFAEKHPPQLLIKLIADAKVVEARKPGETSLDKLEMKIAGVKSLRYAASCRVVTINASLPLEEVLLRVKKELWMSFA